ncbi:VanW family protein [Anaerotardibacter muris]|uniref:VanW family protein n=1 Tax=Anaerotardibacter muris TaxID=2941505 RepID=UPI00203C3BAA|nr:VanW family protein [Anaerotardibacter muris]
MAAHRKRPPQKGQKPKNSQGQKAQGQKPQAQKVVKTQKTAVPKQVQGQRPAPQAAKKSPKKQHNNQSASILVMACSLLIACCIGFGGANWLANPAPVEADTVQTDGNIIEPTYYQETIGTYEAISQSENADRAENLRLAAEAINGYVIEPGATFSFNQVVGETSPERGYRQAPVLYSSGTNVGDGGGICQVSTALYIAAVKADLEIVERHPHSVPSDYAPIGLDATIVYGQRDLQLKNNTDFPITVYAKAVGQKVTVSLLGKPRTDGITIDATSQVVDRYEGTAADGSTQQFYVSESFRIYYKDGVRMSRDLLSSDIYQVNENTPVALAEGSVAPNK